MENSDQGTEDESASSLIEKLGRALQELQNQKDASEDTVQWIEIKEHFLNLDKTMRIKQEELQAREKEYMEKEAETLALLEEREGAVVAKEQEFLDRVQELKDAAVAVISEARANHQPILLESIDTNDNNKGTKLDHKFPSVPLLKAYLKVNRRNSQGKGANAGESGPQVDVNAQELAAVKAVIRCVENYKLEANYPLDPLKKRLTQLVRCTSDRKKRGELSRHQQSKKPRINGGSREYRGGATHNTGGGRKAPPVFPDRAPYITGVPGGYNSGLNHYGYQMPSQSAYGQPAPTDPKLYYDATLGYGSYMGAGTQTGHRPYM